MSPGQDLYVRPRWGIDWDGPEGAAAEANELLAQIAPPSDRVHWLHCFYEPGERWQPVERLVIAEMIPRTILAGKDAFFRMMGEDAGDSLYAELEGPNPRDAGYYDTVKGEFVYRAQVLEPSITQRQWWLWRSHRAYARVFWIIQGKNGGHKKSFSMLEKKILRFNGRPTEPPFPGDPKVPFARFDPRILDKLQAMDKLQAWMEKTSSSWEHRTAEDRNEERVRAQEEIDSRIYDWLDSQVIDLSVRDIGSNRQRVA